MIEPSWIAGLGDFLFCIGLVGVFTRKNAIIVLMCSVTSLPSIWARSDFPSSSKMSFWLVFTIQNKPLRNSPSSPDLISFNFPNPMNKTMNRINPISPEFMSLSKALGMYRCGSMNQWAFSGPNQFLGMMMQRHLPFIHDVCVMMGPSIMTT